MSAASITETIIRKYEGRRLIAYKCPRGIWTIGYGHTGSRVLPGLRITEEQAEVLLQQDISLAVTAVHRLITRSLTDNQAAALYSFVFNLGSGVLQRSSLRQKCNRKEDSKVPHEINKWVYARVNGIPTKLPGLIARRREESILYSS